MDPVRTPHNVVVISHRRSGTHVTIDALRNNFAAYGESYVNLDHVLARHDETSSSASIAAELTKNPRIVKTHLHGDIDAWSDGDPVAAGFARSLIEDSKCIYVYRDGRDVLTSLFHYVRGFDPTARSLSFSEFIRRPIMLDVAEAHKRLNPVEYWVHHVRSWIDRDDVLYLAYEDILEKYALVLERIATFVEQPCRAETKNVVRTRRVPRGRSFMARIAEGAYKGYMDLVRKTSITSTDFRSGGRGGYRVTFAKRDLAFFDGIAGPTMTRMGYDRMEAK